ncbi:hypothetical protein EVAR_30610_1 [Eumeta japonica]|uniref:Uncharacterized protein n=1 Tax=Eumeta variegata TaxID=151549 RepID=A0A4C1W8Y9_EUMVA|nr:hypothetical protein EVAR_30610_1 [Eumeta japonica]
MKTLSAPSPSPSPRTPPAVAMERSGRRRPGPVREHPDGNSARDPTSGILQIAISQLKQLSINSLSLDRIQRRASRIVDFTIISGQLDPMATRRNGTGSTLRGVKGIARESFPGIIPDNPILSEMDKFPYRGIGSSRLDYGDEVRHQSRIVPRRGETRTGKVRFGTLIVCGGSDGAIKRGSFDTYWSGVDQSQRGCRDVGFILPKRFSECVNDYESPRLLWLRAKIVDPEKS